MAAHVSESGGCSDGKVQSNTVSSAQSQDGAGRHESQEANEEATWYHGRDEAVPNTRQCQTARAAQSGLLFGSYEVLAFLYAASLAANDL